MHRSYEMTRNWLLESGICVSNSSDQNHGGVHSFFDEKKNEFAFLYPEITGYFISTMRFLYEHEKNEKFVKLAKASKLNQKDAMYISVIQQLMTKIETLESEVAKLKG